MVAAEPRLAAPEDKARTVSLVGSARCSTFVTFAVMLWVFHVGATEFRSYGPGRFRPRLEIPWPPGGDGQVEVILT
jgi:hypothetical protein